MIDLDNVDDLTPQRRAELAESDRIRDRLAAGPTLPPAEWEPPEGRQVKWKLILPVPQCRQCGSPDLRRGRVRKKGKLVRQGYIVRDMHCACCGFKFLGIEERA